MEFRVAAIVLAAVSVATACAGSSARTEPPSKNQAGHIPTGGVVLYTIGISTDPYGEHRPNGFGVATGLVAGDLEKVEVRSRGLGSFGGAEWLDHGRILVHGKAPPLRRPVIFRFTGQRLEQLGLAPFISGTTYRWSPDGKLLALEPPAPCRRGQTFLYRCWRGSGRIYVARPDGSRKRLVARGTFPDWTPDGRLVFYRPSATPSAAGAPCCSTSQAACAPGGSATG